jgi:hypothetical protein
VPGVSSLTAFTVTSETVGLAVFGIAATGDLTSGVDTVDALEETLTWFEGGFEPLAAVPWDEDSTNVGIVPSVGELIFEPATEAE